MLSERAVKTMAEILQQNGTDLMSVVDAEAFFKALQEAPQTPDLTATLRKHLLPFVTLLSVTVPGAIQLLENAGLPGNYPKGIPDVQALAKNVAQNLGVQYTVIKREFIDEEDGATTLHYVLAAGHNEESAVVVNSRFENPKRTFGASYSIPCK